MSSSPPFRSVSVFVKQINAGDLNDLGREALIASFPVFDLSLDEPGDVKGRQEALQAFIGKVRKPLSIRSEIVASLGIARCPAVGTSQSANHAMATTKAL